MAGAKKKWGQHWLASESLASDLVSAMGIAPGDRFLEIGPGTGRLTRALLDAGALVIAIEVDPECCDRLRALEPRGLRIVPADVLDAVDLIPWDEGPFRVAGNLPYNVSSPILRWTVEHRERLIDAHYMVQLEVAERVVSPPDCRVYGLLSVIVQAAFEARILRRVGPGAFRPPPRVESAFMTLRRREDGPGEDLEAWIGAAQAGFGHRRKKLAKALRLGGFPAERVAHALRATGIDGNLRAENLDPANFARLGRELGRP